MIKMIRREREKVAEAKATRTEVQPIAKDA
jgi:hypothetical protein